jgi:hypothetical protein
MDRNKGRLRPLTFRLSSADWGGLFGQCANWLTESIALIDHQRLKGHFAAYWALAPPVVEISGSPTLSRSKLRLSLKSRKHP